MTNDRVPPDIGLDYLHERCSEVDGCLVWKLRTHFGRPVATIEQVEWQVRRLVWALSRGRHPKRGHYPAMTCTTAGCVHPDHMEEAPRNEDKVGRRLSVTHKAKTAAGRRLESTLSDAAVAQIRASAEPVAVLADRYEKSLAWVYKIRNGEGRRDYSNPFSQLVR